MYQRIEICVLLLVPMGGAHSKDFAYLMSTRDGGGDAVCIRLRWRSLFIGPETSRCISLLLPARCFSLPLHTSSLLPLISSSWSSALRPRRARSDGLDRHVMQLVTAIMNHRHVILRYRVRRVNRINFLFDVLNISYARKFPYHRSHILYNFIYFYTHNCHEFLCTSEFLYIYI